MNRISTRLALAAILSSVVALGACSNLSAREKSTAAGAAIGGVAGSVLSGGSTGAAVGGAVVGGVIGNEVEKRKEGQ